MLDSPDTPLLFSILLRFTVAGLCGVLIGFERDVLGRAAGIRTHLLVAAGSALFAITSILIVSPSLWIDWTQKYPGDVARIAAQIVTGVGFLGAGTIVKDGFTVKGLTTAACLWLVAALGVLCGIGYVVHALLMTVLGLIVIFFGKRFEKHLHRPVPVQITLEVTNKKTIDSIRNNFQADKSFKLTSVNISALKLQDATRFQVSFYFDVKRVNRHPDFCVELTTNLLEQFPDIQSISYKSEGLHQ